MIVMTLLVRDEADIVGKNIAYHLEAGVDRVVAIDNGSTDGTHEILQDYARQGVLDLLRYDTGDYDQELFANEMIGFATARHRPDWIISNDADEFYVAPGGSLRKALAAAGGARVLQVERINLVGDRNRLLPDGWQGTLAYRATVSDRPPQGHFDPDVPLGLPFFYYRLPGKVVFRPKGLVRLSKGAHSVALSGDAPPAVSPIMVHHYPVRSCDEFIASVVRIGQQASRTAARDSRVSGKYRRWFRMLEQGNSPDSVLAEILPDGEMLLRHLADGTVVPVANRVLP